MPSHFLPKSTTNYPKTHMMKFSLHNAQMKSNYSITDARATEDHEHNFTHIGRRQMTSHNEANSTKDTSHPNHSL